MILTFPHLILFPLFFFNLFIIYLLFIYFWLCWVPVSAWGLSPVAASGGHSSPRCAGLSPSRPLPLRCTGSRRAGSVVVAHGPSSSAAFGILPDRGSNPCALHWQADSQPLRHQRNPLSTSWKTGLETGTVCRRLLNPAFHSVIWKISFESFVPNLYA